MTRSYLYLPITSQPRELEPKLLLALVAKEKGMTPVFGYKSRFQPRLHKMPKGFFLVHNARQRSPLHHRLRVYGHQVLVLDEEALVRQSDEIFLRKHHEDAFDWVDHILSWGEGDAAIWAKAAHVTLPKHIFTVGNPRIDLMRPELSAYSTDIVGRLQERYGTFVLLNTNYPTVNNLTPQGRGLRLAHWSRDAQGNKIEDAFLSNKRAMFEAALGLVRELAEKIAPTTLVIRPHPNEDHEPWHAAAAGLDNVHVVFEGGVVPWIIAAKALVHNNCTTAVESAVVGTPVLNFRPWVSDFDNVLSHAFGVDCSDAKTLAHGLERILSGPADFVLDAEKRSLLQHYIVSCAGDLSCDRIVGYLLDLEQSGGIDTGGSLGGKIRVWLETRGQWSWQFVRFVGTKRGRDRLRHFRKLAPDQSVFSLDFEMLGYTAAQFELLMRQFPVLSVAALDETITRFAAATGRFQGMRARQIERHLFTIV